MGCFQTLQFTKKLLLEEKWLVHIIVSICVVDGDYGIVVGGNDALFAIHTAVRLVKTMLWIIDGSILSLKNVIEALWIGITKRKL